MYLEDYEEAIKKNRKEMSAYMKKALKHDKRPQIGQLYV